jgi:hypothetical protein
MSSGTGPADHRHAAKRVQGIDAAHHQALARSLDARDLRAEARMFRQALVDANRERAEQENVVGST